MEDTRIILSGLWVATMLTFLLGDVIRVFAGHFEPGKVAGGFEMTQGLWILISAIMFLPILMVVLSLTLKYPAIRWANIVVAIFFFLFNLVGFAGYEGRYDQFLLALSFVFNGLVVWYAWKWVI